MTDRELLELAAKAAGVNLDHWFTESVDGENLGWIWNPLTDDGDALRLAVKLAFEIDTCQTGVAVRTPNGIKVLVDLKHEPSPYAATRRAIVRAAASIGESIK